MKNTLLFILVASAKMACCQNGSSTKVLLVNPAATAAGIQQIHSPHVALYNTNVKSNHKLFLMIVGTGGAATDLRPMDSIVAGLGYHAISIDYKNNVNTVTCRNSNDSACFDHFRQEIMFGTPVSDLVDVDSANSIINRFQQLLAYLVKNDAGGAWDDYYKNGKIQWGSIVVGGHSQGAGHSAFIGQHFNVSKVLIFSGPQDYRAVFHSPALWLSNKSITPVSKYYAFLHIHDPYDVSMQLADCAAAMHTALPDSVMIKPGVPIISTKHILINDINKGHPHMSTLLPEFKNVWEYMLKQ